MSRNCGLVLETAEVIFWVAKVVILDAFESLSYFFYESCLLIKRNYCKLLVYTDLPLQSITFFPEGEDSYGYIVLSETGEKYFAKASTSVPAQAFLLHMQ